MAIPVVNNSVWNTSTKEKMMIFTLKVRVFLCQPSRFDLVESASVVDNPEPRQSFDMFSNGREFTNSSGSDEVGSCMSSISKSLSIGHFEFLLGNNSVENADQVDDLIFINGPHHGTSITSTRNEVCICK